MNLYPEINQSSSKTVLCLLGCPGYVAFTTMTGTGGCRGLYVTGAGHFFGVRGSVLNEILSDGRVVDRGHLVTLTDRVSMADNGNQLLITDGKYGYILDLQDWTDAATGKVHDAGTFAVITDGDVDILGNTVASEFPGSTHVVFKDGFFVGNKPGTGQFQVSRAYDGETWDASFYSTAEGSPDSLKSIVRTNNELWLFGSRTAEVWYTTGESDFPFQRINGAFIDVGTEALYSPASNGPSVFWLGSNTEGHNTVWMSQGFSPVRISTHAIEYLLGQMVRTDDAVGFCYQQEGHHFYVLTFPTGDKTVVYDMTTGMWHERGFWDIVYAKYHRIKANAHAFFNRQNYVGVHDGGGIYRLDLSTYKDVGNAVLRAVRTFPHVHAEKKRVIFRKLEIDMEVGTALQQTAYVAPDDPTHTGTIQSGQGSDPQLMLTWSDDGGNTWSSEHWQSAGRVGEYRHRVTWRQLGSSRDRVFRVVYSDPVPRVFLDAMADFEVAAF